MTAGAERFDAIVIGSGMGGLTAAALLARLRGWQVALLERQPVLGGFVHGFERQIEVEGDRVRLNWNVGLHAVGGMEPGTPTRGMMDLVTEAAVDWAPLVDPMERLVFPDLTLELPVGESALRARLRDAFPRAGRTIDRCLHHLRRASTWLGSHLVRDGLPGPLALLARGIDHFDETFSNRTVGQWLDEEVADPRLKGVLGARWLDWGLPPEHAALGIHALVWRHFMDGSFVPVGGASRIVDAARGVIEGARGIALTHCEATQIVHADGKATGVQATLRDDDGSTREVRFDAPVVISDAGARTTYGRLLRTPRAQALATTIASLGPTPTAVLAFVGLDRSARDLGIQGETVWIHRQWSHAALWRERGSVLEGQPQLVAASFGASDPLAPGHEVTLMAPLDVETFGARTPTAEESERARDGLIDALEREVPGFRSAVAHAELAWPTTVERFVGHPEGAIYGLPPTPARFASGPFGPTTDVEGVLLAGADAAIPGVMGALMGGVLAATHAPGGPSLREVADAARS